MRRPADNTAGGKSRRRRWAGGRDWRARSAPGSANTGWRAPTTAACQRRWRPGCQRRRRVSNVSAGSAAPMSAPAARPQCQRRRRGPNVSAGSAAPMSAVTGENSCQVHTDCVSVVFQRTQLHECDERSLCPTVHVIHPHTVSRYSLLSHTCHDSSAFFALIGPVRGPAQD